MNAIAKENYLFLQNHSGCAKENFGLDDAGRLVLMNQSLGIANFVSSFFTGKTVQNGVETACLRAKVWGHLIPEIRGLRNQESLSLADLNKAKNLLGEVKKLREENPLAVERFKELLCVLEAGFEEFQQVFSQPVAVPWMALARAAAVVSICLALHLNRNDLRGLLDSLQPFFPLAMRVGLISLAVLAERAALQTDSNLKKYGYRSFVLAGFIGACLPSNVRL